MTKLYDVVKYHCFRCGRDFTVSQKKGAIPRIRCACCYSEEIKKISTGDKYE